MVTCPKCGKEVEEWRAECPYCKINFEKYEKNSGSNYIEDKTNAYYLNILAIINLVISIIGAIFILANYYKDYYDNVNWIGIIGGVAILIGGFTIFFLLKTVIDIFNKVK